MSAIVYWHPEIFLHDLEAQHQAMEARRIQTIHERVAQESGAQLRLAPLASQDDFLLAHSPELVSRIFNNAPSQEGAVYSIDPETRMNRRTLPALRRSAGAALAGLDDALSGRAKAVFCSTYAGHHASPSKAGGFCFFNPVAIAARQALRQGLSRVAILDFDTHSGNGTILSFIQEPRVLFVETYQPGYPGHFMPGFTPPHIRRAKCGGRIDFWAAWEGHFRALETFSPELMLVSAGFDAHESDPLGVIGLQDEDYERLAREIMARKAPVLACLEGGYDVEAAGRCAALFARGLSEG